MKPESYPVEQLALKLFLLFLLIGFIYLPGINGGLIADDFPNIVDKNGIQINHLNQRELYSAWSANTSGLLKRPIASVSFALNYFFSGQKIVAADFKLTNIGIHILNAFLVFFVSRRLFSAVSKELPAQKLGLICALVWAVHPLQLTSVLYIVQRMNSLSFTFMLAGYLIYLSGRLQLGKPGRIFLMYAGCIGCTVLAALTKENGALLPFLMFVTEITLLRCCAPVSQVNQKNQLYGFYGLTAVIPAIIAIIFLASHPNFVLDNYTFRDFNLSERLMTEARALFYYFGLLIYPDNTQLGLFHDDYPVSRSFLNPITTLPAILGIVLLIVTSAICIYRKQYPYLSFAIAWFLTSHSMESSILPLEIMYEHRNYVPSFGIIFSVVGIIYPITQKIKKTALINFLYASLILSLAAATFTRANIWSSPGGITYFETRNHPHSLRAQTTYAKFLERVKGEDADAYSHYILAAQLDKADVSSLVDAFISLNRIKLKTPLSDDGKNELPIGYNAPVKLNQDYIDQLAKQLNLEIIGRLNFKPTAISTMMSLRMATNCLLEGKLECQNMADNIHTWANAAIANSWYPNKAIMAVINAKIDFFQGNVDSALENLTKAIEYEPGNFYYYGETAYLYIVLNQFDKADQILDDAVKQYHFGGDDLLEISRLKETIANGRLIIAKANKIDQGR